MTKRYFQRTEPSAKWTRKGVNCDALQLEFTRRRASCSGR